MSTNQQNNDSHNEQDVRVTARHGQSASISSIIHNTQTLTS